MHIKKFSAMLASLMLLSCFPATMNASANDAVIDTEGAVAIAIEQKSVTLEELRNQNYQVPVFVKMMENPGINAMEFGVDVDERCSYQIINDNDEAYELGNAFLNISMVYSSRGNFTWSVWGSSSIQKKTGINLLMVLVTVPETASAGDLFTVTYQPNNAQGGKHIYRNSATRANFTDISWTDGGVQIVDSETLRQGDLNGDDQINIMDVILINKAIYGKADLTPAQMKAADINGDGKPDANDTLMVMKYIIKLIDTL